MPETETVAPVTESTETFSSFRGNRGAGVPAVKEVQAEPTATESAATQSEEQKPSLEVVPLADAAPKPSPGESDTPQSKQDKFEKRIAQRQREIDALTAKQREAGRDWDEFQEYKRTKPQSPAVTTATEAQAPTAAAYDGKDPGDPEPTQANFTGDNAWQDWLDARAAWVARNQFRVLEAKTNEKRKAEQDAKDAVQAAKDREEAVAERDRDVAAFEEIAAGVDDIPDDFPVLYAEIRKRPVLSNETALLTLHGGAIGARLLYELMADSDKLEAIEKMRPTKRINALMTRYDEIAQKVYGKAEPQTEPAQPKRSSAPKPASTLSGSGPSKSDVGTFQSFVKQKYAHRA